MAQAISPKFPLFYPIRRVWIAFALVFAALAANAWISLSDVERVIRDERKITHIHQTLDQIHRLSLMVADAAASGRLFAITGRKTDLEPYRFADQNAEGELENLRHLTEGDSYQQERLRQLDSVLKKALQFGGSLVELRRKSGATDATRVIAGGVGVRMVDQIKALLNLMESQENGLLEPQVAESKASIQRALATFLVANLAVTALLFLAGYLTARDLFLRKKSEEAIREREERLLFFQDLTEETILVHDQGLIVDVNQALPRLLGYSQSEMIGQNVLKFMDQASSDQTSIRLEKGYPEGGYEIGAKAKDGTIIPLLVHGRDFTLGGRKVRASSGWDLREWKEAQKALRESQERFERFVEVTKEGILLHENGVIVDANPRLLEMTGSTIKELVGSDGMQFLTEDSVEKIRGFLKNGYPKDPYEITFRRKDGVLIPTEVHGRNFHFEGRNLRVASFWDITERKRAEKALRESEERFKNFAEITKEGIFIHEEGLVVDANESLAQMTGYPLEELIGHKDIFFWEPKAKDLIAKYKKEGYPAHAYEVIIRRKDGSFFPAEVQGRDFQWGEKKLRVVTLWDITERKKSEEALKRSEENFRTLIESAPDSILVNREGKIIYVNQRFLDFLGYTDKAQVIGLPPTDIVHPDDRERVIQRMKNTQQGGSNPSAEVRLLRRDGTETVAEAGSIGMPFEGSMASMVILRDANERRKTREALRQSEEKFRSLIENSHDIISITGKDAVVSYISPSVKRILGYDPPEIVGQRFAPIMHPDDIDPMRAIFAEFLKTKGTTVTARFRLRHKSGGWRDIESVGVNLLENPLINAIIYNMRDITEKKQAEEALEQKERRFRALIENSNDVISISSKAAVMSYISPSVKRVLGYDPEERIGKGYAQIMHPDDLGRILGEFKKLVETPGVTRTVAFRLQHKDGSWRYVESTATNLLGNPDVDGIVYNLRDVTEKKQAEESLRQSEENFRNLIENSNDVISLVGVDGKVRYISPSIQKVMGYEPEERMGHNFLEIIHPDDQETVKRLFREFAYKPGITVTAEVRAKHKNGNWRYIDAVATNLTGHPGIRGIIFNYRDITDRKLAEDALGQSEENFRNLIEKSPDAMVVHSPRQIVYVNEALLRLLGYEGHHQLLGKPPEVIVHPDDRESMNDRVQGLKEGRAYNPPLERRFLTREGATVPVEVVSFSILFQGEPMVVAVARDLTERKMAEENFKNLIEKSPDAMVIHRPDKILYANPAFLRLTGYGEAGELVGKGLETIVPPQERERVKARLQNLQAPDSYNPPVERTVLRKDGTQLPVEVVSFSTQFQGGPAVVVVMRDLTERKNTEQTLMKFERLSTIGEMAAGLAHEIRNPLAAIYTAAQLLKRQRARGERDPHYVETIMEQAQRLEQLVEDTMDYARGERPFQQEAFSTRDALEAALRLCQIQFGPSHKKVQVEWDLPKEDLKLKANPQRIQQILINLILNAYQIMPEGGKIRIGLKSEKNSAFIRVEDTGPGITDENMKRIFEPFFTTKGGGSGLGLALSQRIAKEHGGEILVERLQPHGTAFTLKIPLDGNGRS